MRLAHGLLRSRLGVLILVGVATVALAAIATGIEFDFSPQALYAGSGDLLAESEALKEVFGYTDAVLVVLLESTKSADVLTPPALTWSAAFAREAAAVHDVVSVESLATLRLPRRGADGTRGLALEPLVGSLPADDAASARARLALQDVALLQGTFVSADRRVASVLVFLEPDARVVARMRPVVTAVRALLDQHAPPPGYRVHVGGLPAIRTDVVENLEREHVSRFPLTAIVIVLVLILVFRSISGSLLPLVAVGVGMIWTTGAIVLAGQSLNLVSSILPILLFTIGMANAAHIVNRYAEECHRHPGDRLAAGARTLRHMGFACALTYLTTAIGFLSLAAARSQVLQDVGRQTALGLALLYLSTILVLGMLLPRCRPPRHPPAGDVSGRSIATFVAATGRAVAGHPVLVLLVSVALIVASAFAAQRIVVNCRIMETYDAGHPITKALKVIEDKLGGVLVVDASLKGDAPGTFLDPTLYRKVVAFSRFAAAQEGVLRARSYADLHGEVRAQTTGDPAARTALPPLGKEGQLQLRATHVACTLAGEGLHYDAFLTKDTSHARVLIRVPDVGSRRLLELFDVLEEDLAQRFPAGAGVEAMLTGDGYVFARAMDGFIRDLMFSLLGAALVIFAVIALLFRSLRLGLISMLPNLTPLTVTIGYMGLRGYELNASAVIVFAISLGVAVDNTIHFLARFREEARPEVDVRAAIQRSFHGAGRAIVLTSLLILLGLTMLHGSDFVPTRRFAELTSITMVAAFLGDLCLLPACLVLFTRKPSQA